MGPDAGCNRSEGANEAEIEREEAIGSTSEGATSRQGGWAKKKNTTHLLLNVI
jgi:hypothetical protein